MSFIQMSLGVAAEPSRIGEDAQAVVVDGVVVISFLTERQDRILT